MLHKSRIDLSESVRTDSSKLLQQSLASLSDLSLQVKHAHWNCKGPNFIAFHKFLDEVHDVLSELIDTIAERITALGGEAMGTLQNISQGSLLPQFPNGLYLVTKLIEKLAENFSLVGKQARKFIDTTADHGDAGTSDLFTEVSRALDHHLWLLEAHIQA